MKPFCKDSIFLCYYLCWEKSFFILLSILSVLLFNKGGRRLMHAEKHLKMIIKPGEGKREGERKDLQWLHVCPATVFCFDLFFSMSDDEGPHLNILTDVPSHRQSDRSGKWSCFSEHVPHEQTAMAESGGRCCTSMWSPSDTPWTILLHW